MTDPLEPGDPYKRIADIVDPPQVANFDDYKKRSKRSLRPPFPFKFVTQIDPAARKEWLVRGMFGAGEFSIVYGDPGSGKSVLAADLAFHVAAGLDWHGRAVRPGAVLFVAAERAKLTERRLAALVMKYDRPEARLVILGEHYDFFSQKNDALRLADTALHVGQMTSADPVLIVIDTVARVIPGADENHSRDIGRFVENVDIIVRETGAHVMCIHHAGKDKTKGMRGSTALLGAADTTLFVEKLEIDRTATVDKSNDEGEGESITFALESFELFVDPETAETTTAPIVVQSNCKENRKSKNAKDKISAGDKSVLDCLHRAIDDRGTTPPFDSKLPDSVKRVVAEEHWRELVYKHTGPSDEEQSAKRMRFNRGVTNLIERHLVGRNGEWVWPTK